ncbi:negative regulator of the PHO system [Tilletia horrida]|nr:negative regulator of the PHO system [Tilletia horrida]
MAPNRRNFDADYDVRAKVAIKRTRSSNTQNGDDTDDDVPIGKRLRHSLARDSDTRSSQHGSALQQTPAEQQCQRQYPSGPSTEHPQALPQISPDEDRICATPSQTSSTEQQQDSGTGAAAPALNAETVEEDHRSASRNVKAEGERAARVVFFKSSQADDVSSPQQQAWVAPKAWRPYGRYIRVRGSEPLGGGTYAEVVKVMDLHTGRNRASKRLEYDGRPSIRHLTEIELLSKVQRHEGIVELIDVTYKRNFIEIVMPHYWGTLQDLLDQQEGRELRPRRAKRLTTELISAVAHIHQHGVAHLDLKPANLLLTADIQLKVGDFGLAQEVGTGRKHQTIGTVGYTAPECMLGSGWPTFQNDVWSVGCIVAELFTGRPLFAFSDDAGAMRDILKFTGHRGGRVYPEHKYPPSLYCDIPDTWGPFKADAANRLLDIDTRAASIVTFMLLLRPNKRPHLARFLTVDLFAQASTSKGILS